MKKKKYLIGLALAALSMTTLVACGDDKPATEPKQVTPTPAPTPTTDPEPEPVVVEQKEDSIKLNVENKMYDGENISLTCTTTSGKTPKIEYKNVLDADTEYTTTAPKEPGKYVVRATLEDTPEYKGLTKTKEFKIKTIYAPTEYTALEGTNAYIKVTTAKEFLDALKAAQYDYTNDIIDITENDGYVIRENVRKEKNWPIALAKGLYLKNDDGTYTKIPSDIPWDPNDTTYTSSMTYYEDAPTSTVSYNQTLNQESPVKVIEIAADLDLGYNKIKDLGAANVFENWDNKNRLAGTNSKTSDVYRDPDIQASGISKIKVSMTNDLVIYSKNGSKITHAGFSVESCKDVKFENLEMDEMWMWEDSTSASPTITVGKYDAFGWAYFKVALCENITISHCTFGKSFDGQIDYSQPYYQSMGTYSKAPYQGTGANSLHVSYCDFTGGILDEDGYIYKMMKRIEDEYQVYASNKKGYTYSDKSCRYYFARRDSGMTFEDVLKTYAMPQKKAFLWGDENEYFKYNNRLFATLSNCTIKNIEDRLPKVRGGIAYVYNVLVDNTEYYPYAIKYGNTSQGAIAGLDGSVYMESVEYKGIKQYLKNNEETDAATLTKFGIPTKNGGYMIKNSILGDAKGSSTDATNPFESLVSEKDNAKLSTEYFSFKVDGVKTGLTEPPFTIDAYDLLTNGSLTKYFKEHTTGVF